MAAAIFTMLLSAKVAARLGKTLREKVFNRVLKYKICTLEDFKNEHGINCNYPF